MITAILSAFFYVLPFWHTSAWPVIFLFPAPLITSRISFLTAVIWGSIVCIGHLAPITCALFTMADGTIAIRALPSLFLIGSITFILSLWLWLSGKINQPLLWPISLWTLFMFTDRALLLPFGIQEGNPFMNPLLVLPPWLVTLAPRIGIPPLFGLFAGTTSTIGLWIHNPTAYRTIILIFLLAPWAAAALLHRHQNCPAWLETIGYLPIMIPQKSGCSIIQYKIEAHPHLTTIILPESACTQLPAVHPPTNLITGSFIHTDNCRLNIICWLTKNTKHIFEKTHLLPVAEYLPDWLNWPWLHSALFSPQCPATTISINKRPTWQLSPELTIIPYICSELFFATSPPDHSATPILAICNDWWFAMPHFKKIMARAARLKAIAWQRSLLYVSYAYGLYFDEFGNAYEIQRV